MVAAPASQLRPESLDYFALLGLPRKFSQDLDLLQKRYYELSRELHPDRFAAASFEVRRQSLEKMSLVNDAYSTIKDAGARRAYLLELEGIKTQGSSPPMELAAEWFELQDEVMENPEQAGTRIQGFEKEILAKKAELASEIQAAEAQYDLHGSRETLEIMARHLLTTNYLNSLERDVSKLKAKYGHPN